MKWEKGDLVAIQTLDGRRITGVVTSSLSDGQFLRCYLIDEDKYKLLYANEIEFLIAKDFILSPEHYEDPFEIDYSFYDVNDNYYFFYPSLPYDYDKDSDDDSDD